MNRTIQLHGFSKNDEMVFTSLLSLLSNKTQYQWDVVQNRAAEVVVIDVDNESDTEVIRNFERDGCKVITYGQPGLIDSTLQLNKPMRAAAILRCLAEVSTNVAVDKPNKPRENEVLSVPSQQPQHNIPVSTPIPTGVSVSYRLKRWPEPSILKATPGATRICAIMLKQVLSAEEIAESAGLALSSVREFIGNCDQKGYLDIKQRVSQIRTPPAPKSRSNPILAKLRSKFGARV